MMDDFRPLPEHGRSTIVMDYKNLPYNGDKIWILKNDGSIRVSLFSHSDGLFWTADALSHSFPISSRDIRGWCHYDSEKPEFKPLPTVLKYKNQPYNGQLVYLKVKHSSQLLAWYKQDSFRTRSIEGAEYPISSRSIQGWKPLASR